MTSTEQPSEPTQEELRAYYEQLREAQAAEILVQAYTMLGTAAEVKLGRPDARLLIDAMAGLAQGVGSRLGDLSTGMQNGVAQLQMAQVQAERQAAAAQGQPVAEGEPAAEGQGAEQGAPAGGTSGTAPTGAAPSGAQPGAGQSADQRMTDRLWIPGRDPGPRR